MQVGVFLRSWMNICKLEAFRDMSTWQATRRGGPQRDPIDVEERWAVIMSNPHFARRILLTEPRVFVANQATMARDDKWIIFSYPAGARESTPFAGGTHDGDYAVGVFAQPDPANSGV